MHHTPLATNRQRGLSLLEITIALSIMAIVVGAAAPSFQRMLARRVVEGRATELIGDLALARAEAVSRNTTVRVSFIKSSDVEACYVLHTGKTEDCSCLTAAPAVCIHGAQEIKTIVIPANDAVQMQWGLSHKSSYLAFEPTRGTASSYGSITLSSAQSAAIKLVVNSMGRVRACAPAAAWSGYKSC